MENTIIVAVYTSRSQQRKLLLLGTNFKKQFHAYIFLPEAYQLGLRVMSRITKCFYHGGYIVLRPWQKHLYNVGICHALFVAKFIMLFQLKRRNYRNYVHLYRCGFGDKSGKSIDGQLLIWILGYFRATLSNEALYCMWHSNNRSRKFVRQRMSKKHAYLKHSGGHSGIQLFEFVYVLFCVICDTVYIYIYICFNLNHNTQCYIDFNI